MISVVSLMTFGIIIGYFLIRKRPTIIKLNETLTKWAIYILLFLLGLAIGNNDIIMKNLHSLGLKSVIISICATAGSVLLAWLTYIKLFKKKGDEK